LQSLWNDRLNHLFSSAGEVINYSSAAFFQQNKFWLTHVNGDPEFNSFGKSRIFFTDSTFQANSQAAQLTYPGSVGFTFVPEPSQTQGGIRDATEPLTFHVDANVSQTGLQDTPTQNSAVAAVQQIASYLNMKWPGYNHSFVEKWSTNRVSADNQGKREAQQVAWNMFGMAASLTSTTTSTTMNGAWANQIQTAGVTTPSWGKYLWSGPQLDATWLQSRILPETRAARVPRFAISFIATQRNKANTGTQSGVSGTHYIVNVRLWPQTSLPKGLQGLEQLTEAWDPNPGSQSDEIYITHFEATINDGSGSGDHQVIWSSEAPSNPGSNCLYWDSNGRSNLAKITGRSITLNPDGLNYGFKTSQTAWDFSTIDTTTNVTQSRTISIPIFNRISASTPCVISNVKLRFVVASGSSPSNEAPIQISPMRDIDNTTGTISAIGYEAPVNPTDSGAITLPGPFSISTATLTATTPEYWIAFETLDPRVNARGTPSSGATASDDWQVWTAGTPLTGPTTSGTLPTQLADGTRNTRFIYSTTNDSSYPQIGTAGDESKCAWIDTSTYAQKNPSAQQRRLWGNTPGDFNSRMPSIGMISCISTGIQTGVPWRTIKLQPTAEDPPDWLLLDLFAIPWNSINNVSPVPDTEPVPLTLMNNTQGKININAAVFPNSTTPTTALRSSPIEALFLNAYRPNVVAGTSSLVTTTAAQTYNNVTNLYANIASYLTNKTSHHFDYPGELCKVTGISDSTSGSSEWEREALVRQLGSLITTRSNVFSVWGVAQAVKKNPNNSNPANLGVFETKSGGAVADDLITGEKRFHAMIQRYVWPGVDGTVGNGHTDPNTRAYDQLGGTQDLGSTTNSIDATDPTVSSFYNAYNPGAAVMKYRVVYFEYLN
jgi:hypothetical protein